MTTELPNLNGVWAELIIEELLRNGVSAFVISPGSRSTPLTAAAARLAGEKCIVHFDERGGAFFALGLARGSARAAFICTSGSAVANLLPALVEATMAEVPLIVLTADRPPELQNVGANQTIDQTRIFGKYARTYVALPCPDAQIPPGAVLAAIDQVVREAHSTPCGVAHINCPFREPLSGERGSWTLPGLEHWSNSEAPYAQHLIAEPEPDAHTVGRVRSILEFAKRGLVIMGGASCVHADRIPNDRLFEALPWPVFADITSNARVPGSPLVVANYDQLLVSPEYRKGCAPDVIIQIGGRLVSKRVYQLIESAGPKHFLRVSSSAHQDDPTHTATDRIHCSPKKFFDAVFTEGFHAPRNHEWNQWHHEADKRVSLAIAQQHDNSSDITEPDLAIMVASTFRQNKTGALYLGSSMPIRDMDMFGGVLPDSVEVIANRGASGIDGNIATAAGYASATGKRVTAIIGDLAALHDLNSLVLLQQEGVKLTLIIVNNDGGGIFHFLPIAKQTDVFDRYFATPHGLAFEHAAAMFGLPYAHPKTRDEFSKAYLDFTASDSSNIIAITTNREENVALHRDMGDTVIKALSPARPLNP